MSFDLEVLVGHLYIVGGRAINATPPGALVEVAPKKAMRGRELDTFFTLVLPSGDVTAPTSFYEQMAQLAAERFFNNSGSITAALRSVITTLNTSLFEHNDSGRKPYEASMICAALHGRELYVARVGSTVALLQHSGETRTFPEDLTDDEALFRPPLGVQPIPDVRMIRYNVGSSSRLVLGDSGLADFTTDQISGALTSRNIETVLDEFKDLVTLRATLMVMEFVPPGEPDPVPVAVGESTAAISAEMVAARSRMREAALPPTDTPGAPPPPPPREKALQKRVRSGVGGTARSLAQGMEAVGGLLEKAGPSPARRPPSSVLTTAAIGIPLVLVALVVLAWVGGLERTDFERCVNDAQAAADLARAFDSSNRQGLLVAWQGLLEIIEFCENIRTGDPTLASLKREGQQVIDTLNLIVRREAIPVASFPNATISSIVLQGLDLYALDGANNLVYRLQLNSNGRSAAGPPQPIPSMRQGAAVDGMVVGSIFDIAFDDQTNNIVALDTSGVLVRCPPRFIVQCNAQRVLSSENWANPVGITMWRGRLYVLDSAGGGSGQIWRYEPSGGTYTTVPSEYFTGQIRPRLVNAVDFNITRTGTGTVYILYGDGVMTSHVGGEAIPFAFSGFPEGQELNTSSTQRMFLNDSPIMPGFFIISQPTRTIYETTLAGTFIASYRVFDEERLAQLSDVAADPSLGMIYVSSGNAIFAISKE